jgi:hypothetical protein
MIEDDIPESRKGSKQQDTKPGSKDKNGLKTSLETSLILDITMPALNVQEIVTFKVKPSNQHQVLDSVEDLVQGIYQDLGRGLMSVNKEGTDSKLETLRKRALAELADWQSKLKLVDEWKMKVDRAAGTMNKMRDAYFKELFHLREQVYQQKKSEHDGTHFSPSYAKHFDPAEYHIEDEVQRLVADKVSFVQQEFETKVAELDLQYSTRLNSLSESLKTTKIVLTRKEKLCKKLMELNDIQNENEALERVGASAVKVNEEKLSQSINQKIDNEALKATTYALAKWIYRRRVQLYSIILRLSVCEGILR